MNVQIESSWNNQLQNEFSKPYFTELVRFLKTEKASGKIIYPKGNEIFNAFEQTPFNKVKVVILGQDPYHNPGQAQGLCFSVPDGIAAPPSLINIFKELHSDIGLPIPHSGNLTKWARQGILLLNSSLTVRKNEPMSHSKIGWEIFTDAIIKLLSDKKEGLVFLLWGGFAKSKRHLIDSKKHFILTAAHPSPLSATNGFFGCKHFSKTNEILTREGKQPIDWIL
ncbi:MAG: uracil-DNA glycosylase [Chitinophagaceae bacterium]|nr:uracil-DNA glycosylase [Chitinophagaceae bacterium]